MCLQIVGIAEGNLADRTYVGLPRFITATAGVFSLHLRAVVGDLFPVKQKSLDD